jgi:sigma-B regulation protein RsbU (phosphoserine phosphatase)
VGGDFYDVFRVADDRVVVLIGDVMGKGIEAAGLTETVRSAVRALALVSGSPAEILRHVNLLLLAEEHERFASALLLVLDPKRGLGTLASAGHPPPILMASSTAQLLEPRYGPLLGALDSPYEAREFELKLSEVLVLYTDGLTEARREGQLFGEQRLLETLGAASGLAPQVLVEELRDTVLGYAGTLQDDLEILALRR